jgi:hypothetical protein
MTDKATNITPNPDAKLIENCTKCWEAGREFHSFFYGPNKIVDDDAREIACAGARDRFFKLLGVVARMKGRARTPEGIKARARVVAEFKLPCGDGINPTEDDTIVKSMLLDLLQGESLPSYC